MIKQFKIQNSKFKITNQKFKICISSIFLALCTLFASPLYALESTPSSSPSAEVKTKLQMLQADIASRAANLKTEINKKLFNKAYVGLLNNKTSSTFSVTIKNLPKTIKFNQDTVFVVKNKTMVQDNALGLIKTGNNLASLGDIDDNGVLTAKKIILMPDDNSLPKKIVYGIPQSIQNGSLNLKNKQNEEYNINVDKKTEIHLGKNDGSFSDIKINRQLIAVLKPLVSDDKSKPVTYSAEYVYIIPTTLTIKPKVSTPSATPSSTKR